jgi:hypothetical protein
MNSITAFRQAFREFYLTTLENALELRFLKKWSDHRLALSFTLAAPKTVHLSEVQLT